ncbi:MAG TPA: TetR/AcrR family transcriptional regulator [Acidothermaceae bacterium]
MNLPYDVHAVNIFNVNISAAPPAGPGGAHPYHHGDLRNALVDAAVQLAHEGGPSAIVLREAARRVGVSPNAAYRHFGALPDLVYEVACVALSRMAQVMQVELDKVVATGDPARDAPARLMAVGRGYVCFALDEPGLFSTAFSAHEEASMQKFSAAVDTPSSTTPESLLRDRLDELVAVGIVNPADYDATAKTCWAVVHGLSLLLLGPMSGVPLDERPALIDACLSVIGRGLAST